MEIKDYLALPYRRILDVEDGFVVATIAELSGCIAHGADEVEALANLRVAQEEWLRLTLEAGKEPPLPQIQEDLPSGKFVVRLPRYLHQKLVKLAEKDDVSLNTLMTLAAGEHIARREGRAEMIADLRQAWRHTSKWSSTGTNAAKPGPYFDTLKERGEVLGSEDIKHRVPHLVGKR